MKEFIKSPKILLVAISVILFIIPFFWMKPGEMDLGGDSNRLYFYDPVNYLKNYLLYAINPTGFGAEHPLYLSAPFVGILVFLKQIIPSTYFIISLFNGINLVVAFLAMFAITRQLLGNVQKKNSSIAILVSLFVGIYYIFSPVMTHSAWDRELLTHFQVFLNPLIFLLFLKFIDTNKFKYLLSVLVITFIFSTNFSWAAAPPLLAFYPLSLLYLFFYAKFVVKKNISIKPVVLFATLLIFIHSFHLAPLVGQFLGGTGDAFAKTFSNEAKYDTGLNYFTAIAPSIMLSKNLLGLPQVVAPVVRLEFLYSVFILIIVIGLVINIKSRTLIKENKINFLIISVFLLITIFLTTAHITKVGFSLYAYLFNIPGFSMFRNFYGQWQFVYMFFLSLAIGFGLFRFMTIMQSKYLRNRLYIFLIILIVGSAYPFIRGDMINIIINKNQKVEFKMPIKMDPEFEEVLRYFRKDPHDGKILMLPHTESINQMLAGTQGGMYQGPSMISALTGKNDFAGYQVIKPFSENFLSLAKEKNYENLSTLLSLLNIKYIFYNSDPLIMDYFADYPYSHVKNFLPQNQNDYQNFVNSLPVQKNKEFGKNYKIYELNDENYLPHIYVPKEIVYYEKKLNPWGYFSEAFYAKEKNSEKRILYLEKKINSEQFQNIPQIIFTQINPTKYYVSVENANKPYALVFSEAFNSNWKIYPASEDKINTQNTASYFDGDIQEGKHGNILLNSDTFETLSKRPISENNHFVANGYANAWLINPSDFDNKSKYTVILEFTPQRYFYIFMSISLASFILCATWLISILIREHQAKNEKKYKKNN